MTRACIVVPEIISSGELVCIVSMSGGKDSTACALALREARIRFRMVFADTGWEAPETYAHLDHLREKLGPIDVVRAAPKALPAFGEDEHGEYAIDENGDVYRGGMADRIRARAGFPARMQRWCTRELKIEPLRAYHDAFEKREGVEPVCVMGIRAAESGARAKMPVFFDEPSSNRGWGGWIWRPIMHWSVDDVLAIHHRHGVRVNPLYKRGHSRVGCYPCIFAQKEEVRLIDLHAPERIDEIRRLEAEVIAERARRNADTPGRYAYPIGTFFQGRGEDGRNGFQSIDRVVAWSRTSHGGRQLPLLPPAPTEGCARWGMCEPPTEDGGVA